MIEALKATWKTFQQHRAEIEKKRTKFAIALAYNVMYTYSGWPQNSGTWMCPDCNKVHACISYSVFSGRQFPACCSHPEGDRLYKHHATDISQLKG